MKKIIINGEEYQYRTVYLCDEWGEWATYFYKGTIKTTTPKFMFWGGQIIEKPNLIFSVSINIESPNNSKEEVKELINKKLERVIEYQKRKEEILKGEII